MDFPGTAALDEGEGLLGSPGIVARPGFGPCRIEPHGFDAANGRLGWLGGVQRIAHVRPRRVRYTRLAPFPNDKRPRHRGASWANWATAAATPPHCGRTWHLRAGWRRSSRRW